MKKISLIVICLLALVTTLSCSSDSGGSSSSNQPSNLVVNAEIVGKTVSMPNGDGSGVVNFTISANNATQYKILIGSDTFTSNTGLYSHTFTLSGTNTYTVYVSAYNGNKFVSTSINLTVFVTPTLVWSDEFNTNGAPDTSKWSYDIGTGSNGWGNNEQQYYTNRSENVKVEDGLLKITAIKENYSGSNYTSARIVTKDKYSVKYGRIDIRAKLPVGGGTWPALWMLGNNITTAGWPACGEIDIMEHVGNNLNRIYGTLHYPGHSGGNADGSSVLISNATTDFHIYSIDWNATNIKFYVDNQLYYTFNNSSNLPFNQPFFFILNCAMGGNFGGTIDPNFVSSTLEVDYVRVFN